MAPRRSPFSPRGLLALAALCVAAAAPARAQQAPAFCKGLACPRFSVLKDVKGIELRKYEPSSWVSTKGEAMSMDEMMRGGFMKLFNYISGSNAAKSKIDMTSPVLTKIEPGQGPACNSKFTVNFYVPGSGSPAPTEAGVFLSNLPAMEVYVAAYGGYSSNDVAKAKAAEAMEALKAAGEPFDASYWFVAGYDSPYSVIGRHNEVWIPKKQ